MTLTETEDAVRRRTAINDYLKRLLQHKELQVRVDQICTPNPLLSDYKCSQFVQFARKLARS
ncbi:hypothetical protein RchiOBHm_Chr5g0082021 [Rosa chinensis]|uniref:Uncharacterized protein n=1 Tax=Rosa chinensis TaxID=74649 RepID=A0A2P6QN65_ROSCH|nr:hypothetical protein RchiOBHm_Chr5g0082021 [Rosa chinensis]